MKKIIAINLLTLLFTITSCTGSSLTDLERQRNWDISAGSVFLKRPDDYECDYWITEGFNSESLSLLYMPGFGCAKYVDSKYVSRKDIERGQVENPPQECIIYDFSGYVDALDSYAVTSMSITDPRITVYGLTFESSKEHIRETMKSNGFKVFYDANENPMYYKYNCTISFSEVGIYLNAKTTNKNHVIF